MPLEKEIELKRKNVSVGFTANHLDLQDINLKYTNSNVILSGKLLLYKDEPTKNADINSFIDCFRFKYDLTGAEYTALLNGVKNIYDACLYKIKQSVLVESVETNLLNGNSGKIGFQDATEL